MEKLVDDIFDEIVNMYDKTKFSNDKQLLNFDVTFCEEEANIRIYFSDIKTGKTIYLDKKIKE